MTFVTCLGNFGSHNVHCMYCMHLIYKCKPFCQGQTQTYTWYIPKTAGPTSEQEECNVGAYYSAVDVNKVGL